MGTIPLHDLLSNVLKEVNDKYAKNCYYEPPSNIKIKYPCIIYHLSNDQNRFADNIIHKRYKRYTVTIIDTNPDSKIPDKLQEIPYCSLDRVFSSSGLTNFIYNLFYDGKRIKEE